MIGRRVTTWRRWRTVLLCVLLLLPGTPQTLARLSAEHAARQRALAALAPGRNVLPAQTPRHQAASPSPSGASPPYPLNHTFDAETVDLAGGASNANFESPTSDVGTPPANFDIETAPTDAGTPVNHDFATGDFTNWTPGGAPAIQSGSGPDGYYARLGSGAAVTSSAFTVASDAQAFVFDIGWLSTSGTDSVVLYALSGTNYTTSHQYAVTSCSACNRWDVLFFDASAYRGQSVELKLARNGGTVGVDRVRTEVVFPGLTPTSGYARLTEGTNAYAKLGGSLTTGAFTVATGAQFGTVKLKGLTTSSDQYTIKVLSGTNFGTSTQVASGTAADSWTTVQYNLGQWAAGTQIEVQVNSVSSGSIGVDDIGIQRIVVPGWTAASSADRVDDGQGGTAIKISGALTSDAFTLPSDVQELYFRYRASDVSGTGVNAYLLYGQNFASSFQLGGGTLGGAIGVWKTYAALVTAYAGQTVKLKFAPQLQPVYVDDAGIPQQSVPGWTLTTQTGFSAAVPGEDTAGTYVTGANGSLLMTSSTIDTGVVDTPAAGEGRSYLVTAAIGQSNPSQLVVTWIAAATGTNWVVLSTAASTPTGVTNYRFTLYDTYGTRGQLQVKLTGGGKIYSIADNVARQQLAEPFSQQAGAGIDTSTGSFGTSETDLTVQGGPMPLVFTRYYAGHSDRYGELGYRWSTSFDTFLGIYGSDVAVVFGSGKEESFHGSGGSFTAVDVRVKSTLTQYTNPPDGVDYRYVTKDNLTYAFEGDGDLISIVDANGNAITLYRDPVTELVTSIEDPGGRTLTLAYDGNGRLASVTGPDGAEVDYSYDGNGDLVAVDKPADGRTEYVYSKHRLTQIKQRQGADLASSSMVTVLTNTLDEVNRVVAQTDAAGKTVQIAYLTGSDQGITRVTDQLGQDTDYYFDAYARTTNVALPTGEVLGFVYDGDGNLQKVVDPSNGQYQLAYNGSADATGVTDPLGNVTSIAVNPQHLPSEVVVDPGGLALTTDYTYDAEGNLIEQVVDPGGSGHLNLTTTIDRDGDGNPTRVTVDPDGLALVTAYAYQDGNLVSKTVDPDDPNRPGTELDLTWAYAYDGAGRLTGETDPDGHLTRYEYDGAGHLIRVRVDPDVPENPLSGTPLDLTTRYVYDLAGNLVIARDPVCSAQGTGGCQTEWLYDGRGRVTDTYDNADVRRTYAYDEAGRMTGTTIDPTDPNLPGDELNLTTAYGYDESGRLVRTVTDPDGLDLVTEYGYDEAGRLATETVDPGAAPHLALTTTYAYDDAGRLTGKELPDGGVWTYAYDAAGRLTDVTDPVLHVTHYDYDAAGRQVATVVDPGVGHLNLTATTEYDAAGRVTKTTDAEGVETVNAYDRASRLVETVVDPGTAPHLNLTTSYAYNGDGSVASVTDAAGRTTYYEYDRAGRLAETTAPGPRVTTFWYDEDGRQVGTQSPGGLVTETRYDDRGLVTATVVDPTDPNVVGDELNLTTGYAYDRAGRRTGVTNPRGLTTGYVYDAAGRLAAITDAAAPTPGTVGFSHDAAGRITAVENARGYASTFGYDAMGRVTEATDPLSRTHAYEYNGLGQLTRHVDPDGNDVRSVYDGANRLVEMNDGASTVYASYGYDDDGRIVSASNYNGGIGYSYDAAGRVTQVTSPEGTVGYAYNGDGQRTQMTLPGSRTVGYAYGAAGQLATVTDWDSRDTDYAYTADGLLETVTRAGGVHTAYAYDAADRLTAISHYDPADVPLAEYAYSLDADGNRIEAEITGTAVTNATETYAYDELDRLIQVDYDDGVNPVATVDYAYDANGNRVSVDDGATTTTYTYDEADQLVDLSGLTLTYDPNGNRITAGSDGFAYDWANRLTQATVGGTSASFAYLADGTRQSKSSGPTTTNYLYDREAGLPQVLDDGTTSYLRGVGLAAEIDDATGDATSPLADGLGSVRARADETGAVVGTADWDAWGNLVASSGVGGDFGWAGEERDAETGLTFLGSRYYAPGSGRFLTRDALSPNAGGTQGYNGYAYANGNPVTLTDPSGHAAEGGLAGIGQGVAAVFGIVARIIDCILYGECRERRRHGDVDPTKEAISGVPSAGHWGGGGGVGGDALPRIFVDPDSGPLHPGGAFPSPILTWPQPPAPAPYDRPPPQPVGRGNNGGGSTLAAAEEIPWPIEQKWFWEETQPKFEAAGYRGVRIFLRGSRATGWSDVKNRPALPSSDFDIAIVQDLEGVPPGSSRVLWKDIQATGMKLEPNSPGGVGVSTKALSANSSYVTNSPPGGIGVKGLLGEWTYTEPGEEYGLRMYDVDPSGNPVYPEVTYKFFRNIRDLYNAPGGWGIELLPY